MARKLFPPQVPTDPRLVWASDNFTGTGTLADPLDVNASFNQFTGYAVQYVDTSQGDDANNGTMNAPKKYVLAAYNDLADGGTIFVADGTSWSAVPDSGCWINYGGYTPSGFVTEKAVTFKGWGRKTGTQFGSQCVTVNWGKTVLTAPYRRNPGIWLVGTSKPITFLDISFAAAQPVRRYWDYIRNDDLTVAEHDVTSAQRADGYTTVTVESRTYTVTRLSRTSNVTTIRATANSEQPWRTGTKLVLDPGDASDFTAGTYTVTGATRVGYVYDITVADAGANVAPVVPTGASISGHGCLVDDWIELQSTNAQYPSTMYLVTAVASATSFTYRDRYGFGSRSANFGPTANIGTWCLQARYIAGAFARFKGCNFFTMFGGGEKFERGPTVDIGDTAAGDWDWTSDCTLSGSFPDGESDWDHVDPARAANVFAMGYGGVGFNLRRSIMVTGNVYIPKLGGTGGGSYLDIRNLTQEGNFGLLDLRPTVEFAEGNAAEVGVYLCNNVDSANVLGCDLGNVTGIIQANLTATTGGRRVDYLQPPLVMGAPSNTLSLWDGETDSYENRRVVGYYGSDGRLAGKRIDAHAQHGVYQGFPFKNVLPEDMTTWTSTGSATVTPGIAFRDGSTRAFRVSGTGSLVVAAADVVNPVGPVSVGDWYVMSLWMRRVDGDRLTGQLSFLDSGVGHYWEQYSPFGSDGAWQHLIMRAQHEAGAGTSWSFTLNANGYDVDVCDATILWLPAADYSDNDVADILYTFRLRPEYVPVGSVGTAVGQKLFGHGGLGESEDILIAPSGAAATLQEYEPRFTESGTRGYVPIMDRPGPLPVGTVTSVTATTPIASSGGATPNITHDNSGVSAGSYTNASITVDAKGHLTAATSGTAPVTAVTATSPIVSSGGATPNLTHANSGVSAGSYLAPSVTVDAGGHLTAIEDRYPSTLSFSYIGLAPAASGSCFSVGFNSSAAPTPVFAYPASLRHTVQLAINVKTNSFSGGGTWGLEVYQNGVSVAAITGLATGAIPTTETTKVPITGASGDVFALMWTSSGTVTSAGSGISFDANIFLDC